MTVESGKLLYKQNGSLLNTDENTKWIFVLSTSRTLYVGQKRKGVFQHSSFLSGGATTAAGRLVARDGNLEVYISAIFFGTQFNKKVVDCAPHIEKLSSPQSCFCYFLIFMYGFTGVAF